MNKFLAGAMSAVRNHPYVSAAGAITAAELLRSRDCQRSLLTDGLTLVAIGATVNAAVYAASDGHAMMGATSNPSRLYGNPSRSPSGRLTGLPVVGSHAFEHGTIVDMLPAKRGGQPVGVVLTSGKGVGAQEVVVRGRDNRYHIIKRSCGGKSGHPGRALAQGGYAGCDTRNAGRVLGLKSWRDSSANTRLRTESSLRNLTAAFRARGLEVPSSIRKEYDQLKAARLGTGISRR